MTKKKKNTYILELSLTLFFICIKQETFFFMSYLRASYSANFPGEPFPQWFTLSFRIVWRNNEALRERMRQSLMYSSTSQILYPNLLGRYGLMGVKLIQDCLNTCGKASG